MERDPKAYQSYLLRLWKVPANGGFTWRASLEHPESGELEGFADLRSLFDSLRERTSRPLDPDLGE